MVKFFKTSLLYGLLIVLSSALPQWAAAQSRVVSGTVKDEKGTGLPGVTIIVKGTAGGTTSMADGQYSVKVSAGDELEFSFIGYASQTVRIGAQSVVDITLQEQSLLAEEVVVTAYAVQKKVNVTGSISQVKGTDLVATPVANISNALIGNTPGVSGLQTSGEPGHNAANIRIPGYLDLRIGQPAHRRSTAWSNLPSRPCPSSMRWTPIEIQGISVLKDASSTAVYGIRGANGVIIVTTRTRQHGSPDSEFFDELRLYAGFEVSRRAPLPYEYALLRNEAIRNRAAQLRRNGEPFNLHFRRLRSLEVQEQPRLYARRGRCQDKPFGRKTGAAQEATRTLLCQPRPCIRRCSTVNAPQMQVNL